MPKRPQPRQAPAQRHAWDPAVLTEGEIASIKAIASVHRLGFDAIINKVCRHGQVAFAIGGEDGRRETDYALGKQGVARVLLDIVALQLRSRTRGPEPGHVEPAKSE